jgi:AcrR family transcriptional regulator
MSTPDPRPERHRTKRQAIVDAAWEVAREDGLTGLTLRTLASRVGMRQPSLYSYFSSKHDIYDAMFADGNDRLVARMESLRLPAEPFDAVKKVAREITRFSVSDPVRNELLFQRTVPGFEPSEAAYQRAVRFYDWTRPVLARAGLQTQDDVDLFVAIVAGLTNSQIANDPGGKRWIRQVDRAIDMLLRDVKSRRA